MLVSGGADGRQIENFFFFFKQKTAYEIVSRDWSSDVCSSDLQRVKRSKKRSSKREVKKESRCPGY